MIYLVPYVTITIISIISNIPLGYFRENTQKFSGQWLFWIHASIPLIIYLRISLNIPSFYIPISIGLAVAGQIIGGRLRKNEMSLQDKESLQQIPPIIETNESIIPDEQVMVALLNMGGPKRNADVRDVQKRVFSDSLLIRFPFSWAFQKLFAFLMVAFRSKEAEKRYQLIGGGSPIFESTKQQTLAVREELKRRGRNIDVIFSFNYSSPLPDETIQEIKKAQKKYILPVSLYPHYSKATTGSNMHYLKREAKTIYPELKFLKAPQYHLHQNYIQAFTDRIHESIKSWESLDDFYIIFSAHGLPLYFLTEGDPYPFQISQTVAGVVSQLKRNDRWVIAYQSAVGPMQWLKPATGDMIAALANRGIKKILIVPISFVTDHIETTLEIDMEYREIAEKCGIEDFRMSKAIECHPGFINALADTVESALGISRQRNENLISSFDKIPTNV